MTREEQDKLWAELSEKNKERIRKEYNDISVYKEEEFAENDKSEWWYLLKGKRIMLIEMFGKHNLQPALTYEDVAKKLFSKGCYQFADDDGETYFEGYANSQYFLNFTSAHQAKKLLAINKLLNVAKFLNKNEDGSDWVPDWENEKQEKYSYDINCRGEINIINVYVNNAFVHFATPMFAKQAIEILGEDVVITALGNY